MDYAIGNYTDLPESCCQQMHRVYGCANNFLKVNHEHKINTRGCKDTMYSWYRSGFTENIVMSIIGMLIGAYEFYLYSLNRREYFKLLDELDDMRKPMMNNTMSMSTIMSKNGSCAGGNTVCSGGGIACNAQTGHAINFGPKPTYQPRILRGGMETPSVTGSTNGLIQEPGTPQYTNPLQAVQNLSGRFTAPKRNNQPQAAREYNAQDQPQYEGIVFNQDEEINQSYEQ